METLPASHPLKLAIGLVRHGEKMVRGRIRTVGIYVFGQFGRFDSSD